MGLPQRVQFNGVTKFRVPIDSGYLAVMWEGITERRRSSTVSDVLLQGHWNRSFLSKARDKLLAWSATQHGYFTISKPVWELELGAYAQKVFKESVRAGQKHGYADMAMLALFIKWESCLGFIFFLLTLLLSPPHIKVYTLLIHSVYFLKCRWIHRCLSVIQYGQEVQDIFSQKCRKDIWSPG